MRGIAAILAGLTLAAPVFAQTVDQRHSYEQHRIDNGVASGRLTPGEARSVGAQQARIDRTEARMRYRNGGYLTPGQRSRLQFREDRASRHIWRAKHNGWHQ